PPPSIPYPIPPRINSTVSGPINTSFPPPPHPPPTVSPRVTQGLPPPLIPPIVNVSTIPPSPLVNPHFSPLQYSAPPPTPGLPLPLHTVNLPVPAPPPVFTSVPPPSTSGSHHDNHAPHLIPGRVLQSPQVSQQQQNHARPPSIPRERTHVERSPRATPPSVRQTAPPATSVPQQSVPQVKTELSPTVTKKKQNDEQTDAAAPSRNRSNTEAPTHSAPVKRERTSSEGNEEATPLVKSEETDDKDPPAKKRELVAQSLTLENKLVAELIKMKTAAALVAVQENEVCICNAKIQSLREQRHELERLQSRLMAPAVVTMPDLNSRA
ncbi:hypothetical protein Angca_001079, partial [Angiostrongylus cantonensis]